MSASHAAVSTTLPHPMLRVLVAEDDPISRHILEKYLKDLGHTVVLSTNGEECATEFASQSHSFDIVLTDIEMPIMDGFAATKRIREFEASGAPNEITGDGFRTPVFAVSSTLIESEKEKYIEAGLDGWILKPINFARLDLLLRGVFDQDLRILYTFRSGQWKFGGWFDTRPLPIY